MAAAGLRGELALDARGGGAVQLLGVRDRRLVRRQHPRALLLPPLVLESQLAHLHAEGEGKKAFEAGRRAPPPAA